ncbi:titin-like isoform X2 [Toxorhynchites rutilus septentrionalis]|uniref:titin-like isoform X2 n=1 Tax=Toxorhynchites rutilus septentrionalis TaxID=329112 RepID=UPI00247A1409|nr:titin-like isoform X2 [Toxorhynchites rutilus septentrionalis]
MPLYSEMYHNYIGNTPVIPSSKLSNHYIPPSYVGISRGFTSPITTTRTPSFSRGYIPKLTPITETPLKAARVTALTRVSSPKFTPSHSSPTYQKPRRVINTADIDVSASRYGARESTPKWERYLSSSPTTSASAPTDSNNNSIVSAREQELIERNEQRKARSAINRNRTVVRLNTIRARSKSRGSRGSTERKSPRQSEKEKSFQEEMLYKEPQPKSTSWRDQFREEIPLRSKKPVEPIKSPGELLLEKHLIRDEDEPIVIEEIILEPPTIKRRATIRRKSAVKIPSFHEICSDINSDRLDDDLNAGELRRRASQIIEDEIAQFQQELEITNGVINENLGDRLKEAIEQQISDSGVEFPEKKKLKKIKRTKNKPLPMLDAQDNVIYDQPEPPSTAIKIFVDDATIESSVTPKIMAEVESIEECTVFKFPKKKKKITVVSEGGEESEAPKPAKKTVKKTDVMPIEQKSTPAPVQMVEVVIVDKPDPRQALCEPKQKTTGEESGKFEQPRPPGEVKPRPPDGECQVGSAGKKSEPKTQVTGKASAQKTLQEKDTNTTKKLAPKFLRKVDGNDDEQKRTIEKTEPKILEKSNAVKDPETPTEPSEKKNEQPSSPKSSKAIIDTTKDTESPNTDVSIVDVVTQSKPAGTGDKKTTPGKPDDDVSKNPKALDLKSAPLKQLTEDHTPANLTEGTAAKATKLKVGETSKPVKKLEALKIPDCINANPKESAQPAALDSRKPEQLRSGASEPQLEAVKKSAAAPKSNMITPKTETDEVESLGSPKLAENVQNAAGEAAIGKKSDDLEARKSSEATKSNMITPKTKIDEVKALGSPKPAETTQNAAGAAKAHVIDKKLSDLETMKSSEASKSNMITSKTVENEVKALGSPKPAETTQNATGAAAAVAVGKTTEDLVTKKSSEAPKSNMITSKIEKDEVKALESSKPVETTQNAEASIKKPLQAPVDPSKSNPEAPKPEPEKAPASEKDKPKEVAAVKPTEEPPKQHPQKKAAEALKTESKPKPAIKPRKKIVPEQQFPAQQKPQQPAEQEEDVDFWSNIGTRETISFARRKQVIERRNQMVTLRFNDGSGQGLVSAPEPSVEPKSKLFTTKMMKSPPPRESGEASMPQWPKPESSEDKPDGRSTQTPDVAVAKKAFEVTRVKIDDVKTCHDPKEVRKEVAALNKSETSSPELKKKTNTDDSSAKKPIKTPTKLQQDVDPKTNQEETMGKTPVASQKLVDAQIEALEEKNKHSEAEKHSDALLKANTSGSTPDKPSELIKQSLDGKTPKEPSQPTLNKSIPGEQTKEKPQAPKGPPELALNKSVPEQETKEELQALKESPQPTLNKSVPGKVCKDELQAPRDPPQTTLNKSVPGKVPKEELSKIVNQESSSAIKRVEPLKEKSKLTTVEKTPESPKTPLIAKQPIPDAPKSPKGQLESSLKPLEETTKKLLTQKLSPKELIKAVAPNIAAAAEKKLAQAKKFPAPTPPTEKTPAPTSPPPQPKQVQPIAAQEALQQTKPSEASAITEPTPPKKTEPDKSIPQPPAAPEKKTRIVKKVIKVVKPKPLGSVADSRLEAEHAEAERRRAQENMEKMKSKINQITLNMGVKVEVEIKECAKCQQATLSDALAAASKQRPKKKLAAARTDKQQQQPEPNEDGAALTKNKFGAVTNLSDLSTLSAGDRLVGGEVLTGADRQKKVLAKGKTKQETQQPRYSSSSSSSEEQGEDTSSETSFSGIEDDWSSDEDDMANDKPEKKKFDPQKRVKLNFDHMRKCYSKEEKSPIVLVARPRPLWKVKRHGHGHNRKADLTSSSSSGSEDESGSTSDRTSTGTASTVDASSDINTDSSANSSRGQKKKQVVKPNSKSSDIYDNPMVIPLHTEPPSSSKCSTTRDENNNDSAQNASNVEDEENNKNLGNQEIRSTSTSSHDSGFCGGGTAPISPKKAMETSYTYAQFQKTGKLTAPATVIPRFRKYNVDDFHFLTVLGKGSFGKVFLAELRNTEYYYAVKCLKKDVVLEDDDVDCTLIERKVLALGTKHPFLCHLFCTFQTDSHLFFVMEYLNGGDLMFHIQQSGRFTEGRARFYAAEIMSGLKFLHRKGIVYRDLKLDNVLLDYDGHVRIADFGMCKLEIYLDRLADSFCGTPDYMAPEIIKGQKYNQAVDWWSFGVLVYEMLVGQSPFSGCDEDELFWSICNEIPWFPHFLSKEALKLLQSLLEKDASIRLGCLNTIGEESDPKYHPFFDSIDWHKLERRGLDPPFKPQVRHPLDTQYFDKQFTRERARLTPIDRNILASMNQAQFEGFTYTNPNNTLTTPEISSHPLRVLRSETFRRHYML